MNKNVKTALEEAMASLNITETAPAKKQYTIVEFCNEYLNLPLEETIELSRELVYDIPVVYLKEDNWGDSLQRGISTKASSIGNNIRQMAQKKFGVGSTGNKPTQKQGWNRPVAKVAQGVQNLFNTKGAALRNSPLIRVDDNTKGVTKYIAFPDLDLSRPGHKRILDTLVTSLSKDGKTAQQINIAAPERDAAQRAGNYAEIDTPDGAENKKEAVEAALQQLEDLITTHKDQVNQYSFMSQEELEAIQKQITAAAGQANQTINAASQESQADTSAMAQEASTSAAQPSGQSDSNNAYSQEMGKIQSMADAQGQPTTQPDTHLASPEDTQQVNAEQPAQPIQQSNAFTNQANDLATSAQAKMSEPIDASKAADAGTQFQLNPGTQTSSPNPSGATFNTSVTAPVQQQETGFEPVEGEVPGQIRTPLEQQLANQPQGTIEDTINDLNAANSSVPNQSPIEQTIPADPNKVKEIDKRDLESDYTDPTDFAHV